MKMVLLILIAVLFTVAQCQQVADDVGEWSETEKRCLEQVGANETEMDYFMKELYMPDDDISFTKFIECTWRKDGFINRNNDLVLSAFRDFIAGIYAEIFGNTRLAEEFARRSVAACEYVKGYRPGQKGIRLMNCVMKMSIL